MAAQSRGSVKGLGLAAERLVAGDGDRGVFFAFGEDLEQQLGAALAEVHVAEVVGAEQVDAAVAGDGLGQWLVVGDFGELVTSLKARVYRIRWPASAAAAPRPASRWDFRCRCRRSGRAGARPSPSCR